MLVLLQAALCAQARPQHVEDCLQWTCKWRRTMEQHPLRRHTCRIPRQGQALLCTACIAVDEAHVVQGDGRVGMVVQQRLAAQGALLPNADTIIAAPPDHFVTFAGMTATQGMHTVDCTVCTPARLPMLPPASGGRLLVLRCSHWRE